MTRRGRVARRSWVGAAALLLLLVTLRTRADEGASDPSATLRSALQAYEADDLASAQRWFEQAHSEQPTARTLRGLGVVAYRQGRWVDAYAYLTGSLASPAKPLTDELRARVLTLVDEIGAKLTRVHVQLSPADAVLRVDGSFPAQDASGAVLMLPGAHRLSLEAPGHVASEWALEARAGSEQLRSWQLARDTAATSLPASHASADAPADTDARGRISERASRAVHLRRWGYGSLAGAVAGLVMMGVGLGLGFDRLGEIEDFCRKAPGGQCSPAVADAAVQDARLDLLSGLTISGAVLAGVGAVASTSLLVAARRIEADGHNAVGVSVGLRGAF